MAVIRGVAQSNGGSALSVDELDALDALDERVGDGTAAAGRIQFSTQTTTRPMKVVVVGLGYVGAVTAACLAELGHTVVGVDTDQQKAQEIEEGRSPIVEPKLGELVASGRKSGRLSARTTLNASLRDCDAVIVCVGTPAESNGMVHLEYVERVSEEIGRELAQAKKFVAVLYRSTVPPGTVDGRLLRLLERESAPKRIDHDFGVAMVPEFLREGSGVHDFFDPPFTVAGVRENRTLEVVSQLLADIGRPTHALSIREAEAVKYTSNAFHALKITFANEIGRLLKAAGVDARQVMRVFCQDDRLNISAAYLRPGFAFGGSCLPKDLQALTHIARLSDVEVPVLSNIMRSNESNVRLAVRHVLDTETREVALLGLSFKPETDDLRESPYVELAEALIGKGIRLRIFDPIVNPERLIGTNRRYIEERLPHLGDILVSTPSEALDGVSVTIVATADPGALRTLVETPPEHVLDLHGGLGPEVEALPGYQGFAW
jgi:GDP-mannose 6-dehydrogenase